MLIMVDGVRTVAQLRAAANSLGAPPDFLLALENQGLVAPPHAANDMQLIEPRSEAATQPEATPTDAERFQLAQKYMIECAVDAMGLLSFFFTLKLEKCFTTNDLRALLPELVKSVTKARGEAFARAVALRVEGLLG